MDEAAPERDPETGASFEADRDPDRTGVWPPAPTYHPPPAAYTALDVPGAFASIGPLSWVVTSLLALYALLSAAVLGAWFLPANVFRQTRTGVDITQALLLLATGLCFLIWTYRLSRNLRVLGVAGLQFTPGWAVGYFFVPIIGLYRPYQVFREIWQASDPGPAPRSGRAWRTLRSPALLGFWWVLWLVFNLVDRLAVQTPNDPGAGVAGATSGLVSAVFALLVVRAWTARQEKTARHLALLA